MAEAEKKKAEERVLRVRAKGPALGFYGGIRRRPGEVFNLRSEDDFSHEWMVAEGWTPPPKKEPIPERKPADLAREIDELQVKLDRLAKGCAERFEAAGKTIAELQAQIAALQPKKDDGGKKS